MSNAEKQESGVRIQNPEEEAATVFILILFSSGF